jgi:hypothetical protein
MSKNQPAKGPRSLEENVGAIAAQLEIIMEKLQLQESRFDKLETLLTQSKKENEELREQLRNKDEEILDLRHKVNDVEQHNRSYNIRIFNLPLDGDTHDTRNVMRQVFNKVLSPILQGAVEKGRLHSLPGVEFLLETAHILPGKPSKPNPIICRFFNRYHRTLLMQHKKEYAPRMHSTATGTGKPPAYQYPIYEDITSDTFRTMRAISSHPEVSSCWAAGGVLRFRLKNSDSVHRVKSVYEPVEKIVNV